MKAEFLAPRDNKSAVITPLSDSRVIVSADIGDHYAQDFVITKRNCDHFCGDAWRLYYSDYPDGCPTHEQSMYAFKIYAMDEAIRAGFRYVLWMDSSLAPIAPIDPLWETIAEHGWYAAPSYNGITNRQAWRHWETNILSTLGEWCSDDALEVFGITRQTALTIPLALTGLVGLDIQNPIAQEIWRRHKEYYALGIFNGAHTNLRGRRTLNIGGGKFTGHVSMHSAVLGHRHDETSLSFILHSLGLAPMNLGYWTLESENGFIGQFVGRYNIRYKGATVATV